MEPVMTTAWVAPQLFGLPTLNDVVGLGADLISPSGADDQRLARHASASIKALASPTAVALAS
jgi:hypothetical protein